MNHRSFPTRHGTVLQEHLRANLRRFDPRASHRDGLRHAAVGLIVVPNQEGDACFLLTRRSSNLSRHRGQWALPGGRVDAGETSEQAVLRETQEEVGLALGCDDPIGRLDDFQTRSGYCITPVVVWCDGYHELVPDPDEVEQAFRIPIADIDRPDVPVLHEIPESDRPVLSMPILGGLVHAPTAALIYQFLEVALRGNDVRVAHYEQPMFAWR